MGKSNFALNFYLYWYPKQEQLLLSASVETIGRAIQNRKSAAVCLSMDIISSAGSNCEMISNIWRYFSFKMWMSSLKRLSFDHIAFVLVFFYDVKLSFGKDYLEWLWDLKYKCHSCDWFKSGLYHHLITLELYSHRALCQSQRQQKHQISNGFSPDFKVLIRVSMLTLGMNRPLAAVE